MSYASSYSNYYKNRANNLRTISVAEMLISALRIVVSPRSCLLKFLVSQGNYHRSRLSKGTRLINSKRSYPSRDKSIYSSKGLRTSFISTRYMEIPEDAYQHFNEFMMGSARRVMKSHSSKELVEIKHKKSLPIVKECSFPERRCLSILKPLTQSVKRSWNTF